MFYTLRTTAAAIHLISTRWCRSSFVVAVALVVLAGASSLAEDKADSGWVVGQPAVSDQAKKPDPNSEIVFGEDAPAGQASAPPKLNPPAQSNSPSPQVASTKKASAAPSEPRVAARSTTSSKSNSNGWRSVRSSRSQSQAESGPAPPLPTKTTPSFLLPTTPPTEDTAKSTSEKTKSSEANKQDSKSSAKKDQPKAAPAKVTVEQQLEKPAPHQTGEEPEDDAAVVVIESGDEESGDEEEDVEIIQGDEPVIEVQLPPLSKEMMYLRARLRRVLKSYYRRPLNSSDNDPWEVMHGMLAFGIHSRIHKGSERGELITSVGWLCYNKPCKWQTLLYVSPEGDVRAKYGVGLQGHMGQFLAMLAQCKVSPDYPIRVEKKQFVVQDLIQSEMDTCYPRTELTFKLIALMHYLESDAKWVNDQGQDWSISRLIKEELAQPIRGAACGGTHRLAGLSLAAHTRVKRGEPLDGEFERASKYVQKYHEYAFRFQNRDGSLSTNWFRGRGTEEDINRRVKTTGHILEWLCYSLNDDEMRDWRTTRATQYLTNLLYNNYNNEWEVGPICHALHALILYDERIFQPYDEKLDIADQGSRKSASRNRSMPAWMR